jgi:hypothetical protein
MADVNNKKAARKKILVFSANAISDLGIDLAGSAHMHYSTSVQVISLRAGSSRPGLFTLSKRDTMACSLPPAEGTVRICPTAPLEQVRCSGKHRICSENAI